MQVGTKSRSPPFSSQNQGKELLSTYVLKFGKALTTIWNKKSHSMFLSTTSLRSCFFSGREGSK